MQSLFSCVRPGNGSRGVKDPLPKQGKPCTAIHHPLDQLEPVDVPLGDALAVGQLQAGKHCRLVPLEATSHAMRNEMEPVASRDKNVPL